MARIELSNIGGGGGGGTLTLTTTGTSGASTLVGTALNIPTYQGQLTLSTAGTSGASTLVGNTLTIPTYQGQVSLTTTGTSGASTFVGNTLNVPQYQGALTLTTTGSGAATLVGTTLNIPTPAATAPGGSNTDIQYNNSGAFAGSSNLRWDNSNVRLNIGAPSSPTGRLNVKGSGVTSGTVNLRLTDSGNTELLKVLDNGSTNIGTGFNWDNANNRLGINSATGSSGRVIISSTGQRNLVISSTNNETTGSVLFTGGDNAFFSSEESFFITIDADNTQTNRLFGVRSNAYGSIGGNNLFSVDEAGNTTCGAIQTTGAYRLDVNSTTNTVPAAGGLRVTGLGTAGGKNTVLAQNSNSDGLFKIEDNGKITYWATNTAAGTTGAQTINRPSGTVNFAAGATSLVVTNSLCTTSSIVLPVVRTADTTAYIKNVVPGAGSFTIELGAAATAETSVGFFIIN